MSKAEDRVARIAQAHVGASGKRVLLVEGPDDVKAFRQLLSRRAPGWEGQWAVADAGGKKEALAMAALVPTWRVVVDRDEWSTEQLVQNQALHPNLSVLPRFCLESYLVDPEELWRSLPEKQQLKIAGGEPALRAAMLANLADWQRHAALWHVINPLWSGLRALGFKEGLLKTHDIPDDLALKATLGAWSALIDANRIFDEVQTAVAAMIVQPAGDFLHRSLYAKDFYPQVVHPTLDRLLGAKPPAERRAALFKTRRLPADLEPLWLQMGIPPVTAAERDAR